MLAELDNRLFFLINGKWTSPFLDAAAVLFQEAWVGLLIGAVVAAALYFKGGTRGRTALVACIAAVILSDLVCSRLLKPFVARLRPSAVLEGVRLLMGRKSGFGFPSNHAANMAAVAAALGSSFPRWAWLPAILALFVGYTRIYAGVHYPGDVIGGFLVGAVFGAGAFLAARHGLEKTAGTKDRQEIGRK